MASVLDLQAMEVPQQSGIAAASNASIWECCSTGSFSICC